MSEKGVSPELLVYNKDNNMGIVEKNYEDLLGVCKHVATQQLGGPARTDYSSEAEDIAQNVIVMLLEKEAKGELREEDMFGLAKGMARLRSITYITNETRRREIEQEHGPAINRTLTGQSAESLAADPSDLVGVEDLNDRLNTLSPLLYSTAMAFYLDGQTVEHIAKAWGITEDVVYKRLQRARDIVTGETDA